MTLDMEDAGTGIKLDGVAHIFMKEDHILGALGGVKRADCEECGSMHQRTTGDRA